MKTIKMGTLSTILFLFSALFTSKSFSAPIETCPAGTCAPCGYEIGCPTAIAPYDCSVNPLVNYVATAETTIRRGYFGGFYIGAAYGGGWLRFDPRIARRPLFIDDRFSRRRVSRGYLVTVVNVGFNLVLNCFFLGAELGYNNRSRVREISFFDDVDFGVRSVILGPSPMVLVNTFPCRVQLDINSRHSVSADLLPGFAYNRFVAYLRLGVEQGDLQWQRRFCFPVVRINIDPNFLTVPTIITVSDEHFVESRSQSISGFRAGLGFGYAVSPHVSLHLNYIHIFSNRITITPRVLPTIAIAPAFIVPPPFVVSPPLLDLTRLAASNTIEPQRNEVNFGVWFRF